MRRRRLPWRRPCDIEKIKRDNSGYYVIIDRDPKNGEPRGLHCHGPKPGSTMWTLLHEICPLISRNIQAMDKPEVIKRWMLTGSRGIGQSENFSVIGDILDVFVKHYKEWMKENGIKR